MTLAGEPDTQFNAPRFSPDGRTIVAERRRLGSLSHLVLVEVSTGALRVLAADRTARIVTPTWTPDGHAVIAAADYGESPFNLFEYSVDGGSPRRLTALGGGATWPDVSSDGRTIVFAGYTVDGFDVFTLSYAGPAGEPPVSRADAIAPATGTSPRESSSTPRPRESGAAGPYRPWQTLGPTSWSPIVESDSNQFRAGAAVAGADVLGRHGYAVSATWLVNDPDDVHASTAPDWNAVYAYDGWRPTFFASASRDTSFGAGPADANGRPTSATLVERAAEMGMVVRFRHVRQSHSGFASVRRTTDDYSFPGAADTLHTTALRFGWTSTTAHIYGYSISPEDGITAGGTAERLHLDGAAGTATTATTDVRAYVHGLAAHHVVALRAAGGWSVGDRNLARVFHLGGSGPDTDVLDFGRSAISLLRGFAADTFAGTRIALVNAEYRLPLARPQRGVGTFPLFLHTVHAAVFADAGSTWTREFVARDAKLSAGGEISTNVVAGYAFPLTVALGAAWGRDGAGVARGGAAYVRVGRAF